MTRPPAEETKSSGAAAVLLGAVLWGTIGTTYALIWRSTTSRW